VETKTFSAALRQEKKMVIAEDILTGKNTGSALANARKKLASSKEIKLSFPGKAAVEATPSGDRWTTMDLIDHANERAHEAFEWISNVAMPFIMETQRQVEENGRVVLKAICEDGSQTRQSRLDDYETLAQNLLAFSSENDGIFHEEVEKFPAQAEFVSDLCMRVRYATQLAMHVFDIRHAESKAEFEGLLKDAKDSAEENAINVFTTVSGKAPMHAFGKGYDLLDDAFGDLHKFGREKLTEPVNSRAKDLAKANAAEIKKRVEKISAPPADEKEVRVKPEELLFGEPKDVNGSTAVFKWTFGKSNNVLILCREDDVIYVDDAAGEPLKALEEMRKVWKDPYVVLARVLSKDGQYLCPEDAPGRYNFGGFVQPESFAMTRWVRTAAGACVSSRLLPNANAPTSNGNGKPQSAPARKKLVKAPGEFLTDEEFLYKHGYGEYKLVFTAGFHYEPRDAEGKPTGEVFNITEDAEAILERKEVDGKDKIAINSISSEELVTLLASDGAEAEHEYYGAANGSSLPIPLRLGISQAFKRLKLSEVKTS
jgi:hypothetical protein